MTRVSITRKINVLDPSALPAWLQSKSLLTWYSLPGTAIINAMSDLVLGTDYLNSTVGITAYCGTAFKESGSVVLHMGGGHADYSGNDVYALTLSASAPAWTRLRAPTKVAQYGFTPGPTEPGVSHYADGRPTSRHTYAHNQFIAARNRVFMFGAAAVFGNGNGGYPVTDAFNLATNDYDTAGTWPAYTGGDYGGVNNFTVKDASENVWKFIKNSGRLLKWDQASATISVAYTDSGQDFTHLGYDPVRNRVLRVSQGNACYYDLNAGVAKTAISFSGSAGGSVSPTGTTIWCPDRSKFLHLPWYQASSIIEIDPISFAAEPLSLAGTPPSVGSDGHTEWNSRFFYAPELKTAFLMPRADMNIYFFRVG